jgi:hypothetical protein
MAYQVLTTEHDSMRLVAPPTAIWIISTLEVTAHQESEAHLLLTLPSYAFEEAESGVDHGEGYWAPPFVAYPVPISFSPPTSVGSLRRLIDRHQSGLDLMGGLAHLAYQLGLRDTDFAYRGEFIEVKTSPRSPGLVKAYRIVRHGLVSVDETSLRNLADPDVRRGFVFLPLDTYTEVTRPRDSPAHGRVERWFLGKPLISNVEHVVAESSSRSVMRGSSIELPRWLFSRTESGLLCTVDLAGYGAALKYAAEKMHSFSQSRVAIQEAFRKSIASQFERMLGKLGVTQMQTAGDGFLAALPGRVFPDVAATVDELLRSWAEVLGEIAALNAAVQDLGMRVGSRMSLHRGNYEYGRIGGISSFAAAFDGSSVIEVARLDQGLSAAMRSGLELSSPEGTRLYERGNYVLLSRELRSGLGDNWRPSDATYRYLGLLELTAKEFRDHAEVWSAVTEGEGPQ